MFAFLLFSVSAVEQNSVMGGFVKFSFPQQHKADLFSKLTVVIKTPAGILVDQTVVQPTGYWVVQVPKHRELIISIHGPQGVVFSPPSEFIQFPFNKDIDFYVQGFSVIGEIVTKGSNGNDKIRVSIPLDITCTDGQTTYTNKSTPDGTFIIGPLKPGKYTATIKDVVVKSQDFEIKDSTTTIQPLFISDWPQNGQVIFPDGIQSRAVKLNLSGTANQIVTTDDKGKFSISGLQIGSYHIKSLDEDVVISPVSFSLSASKLPTTISLNYLGIRIHGSINSPDGIPCQGIRLTLQPIGRTSETDSNGNFVFNAIPPMTDPKLDIYYPYYTFSEPEIPSISTFPIEEISINILNAQICGKVECPETKLVFTGAISQTLDVTNGSFCVSSPYSKQVVIESISTTCGFENNKLTVKSPTNSVKFARIKAKVTGKNKCIGPCSPETTLTLTNDQYVYQTNMKEDGSYEFPEVEFGKYEITVKPPANERWEVTNKDVHVTSKVTDAGQVCQHTEYIFSIIAPYNMNVKCADEEITLQRGVNKILTKSTLLEPNDCHLFKAFNLKTSNRINTTTIFRQIKVNGVPEDESDVFVVYKDGVELPAPYTFTQELKTSCALEVKTKAPYVPLPSKLVVSYKIESDGQEMCNDIVFDVIRGIEYRGKIVPPIQGVIVSAISAGKTISTAETNENGEYSLGSYNSTLQVNITAAKAGFKFVLNKKGENYDFTAEKLASIHINFNYESNVNPKGILVSISNEAGFNRAVTGENVFKNIEAGSYYVQPIYKEHKFEPTAIPVVLKEGEEAELNFTVIRVRFGISGEVRRVTGEAEPDVEIEAIFSSGDRRMEVTDATGRFRIGDLEPDQDVTLIPHASSLSPVDRVTPGKIHVTMGADETKGIRFLSMKSRKSFDILGEISVEPTEFLETMTVALFAKGSVHDRFTFASKSSNHFFFTNLTEGTYSVVVANTRQLGSELNCPSQEVDLGQKSFERVKITCETVHQAEQIRSQGMALMVTFVATLLWILCYNFSDVKQIIVENLLTKNRKSKKNKK